MEHRKYRKGSDKDIVGRTRQKVSSVTLSGDQSPRASLGGESNAMDISSERDIVYSASTLVRVVRSVAGDWNLQVQAEHLTFLHEGDDGFCGINTILDHLGLLGATVSLPDKPCRCITRKETFGGILEWDKLGH